MEDDKLFAEFLGLVNENGYYKNDYHLASNLMNMLNYTRHETDLHFKSKWDWLMEVVDKIMGLCEKQTTFICHNFRIGVTSINIKVEHERRFKHIDCYYISYNSKIEAIYNACIEFIKWYNEITTK